MAEILAPIVGDRVILLDELEKLRQKEESSQEKKHTTPVYVPESASASDKCAPADAQNEEANGSTPIEAAGDSGQSASSSVLWSDLQDYRLPAFPPYVKTLLETQRNPLDYMPGTNNRRSVIDVLTRDLEKQDHLLVSRKGYSAVLNALFKDYPYLGDPKCWRRSLRNKMKLLRLPLTSSCILELKEKFGSPGMKRAQKRPAQEEAVRDKDGLVKRQKHQDLPPDEDAQVIQLHLNILKQEMRKATPDLQLCQRKMEKTFTYRHQRRYNPDVSVAEIFEDFPTLRYKNFLAIEAKSLNVASPGEMWDKLHGSIIHLMKFSKQRSKNYYQFHSRYIENLDSTMKGEEKKEHGLLFAVQMIPSLFREDEGMLIMDSIEMIKSPTPTLVMTAKSFQVFINGEKVLNNNTTKFSEGLEVLYYCFWVFAIEYPKEIKNTMLFLEKIIFKGSTKVPSTVMSWAKKIGIA